MSDESRRLRRYAVHVTGYTAEQFDAPTASAARYAAFKVFCEATRKMEFLDFLRRVHIIYIGVAS